MSNMDNCAAVMTIRAVQWNEFQPVVRIDSKGWIAKKAPVLRTSEKGRVAAVFLVVAHPTALDLVSVPSARPQQTDTAQEQPKQPASLIGEAFFKIIPWVRRRLRIVIEKVDIGHEPRAPAQI
jgi:hypothetical protein